MKSNEPLTTQVKTSKAFEDRVANQSQQRYVMCLYVAGLAPCSTRAVEGIRAICERYLPGRYQLTVIDLYLHPEVARQAQIVVIPTLIMLTPSPKRLFVGDMTDEKRILQGMQITP